MKHLPVSTLLLMPAWSREWTGLKTVVVKSDNAAKNLPTVQASYLLIKNDTGETVAIMDGTELTRRRTAAASALAADYLARPDASTLVLVGAGALGQPFCPGPCGGAADQESFYLQSLTGKGGGPCR